VTWTIDELVLECARALGDEPQPSGRVTDAPDLRTIRYYATLGLIDPPRAFDKKRALYDERHLLQLLAIKRLQRGGLALADVQRQLAGITDTRLRTLARTSLGSSASAPDSSAGVPPPSRRFWTDKPREVPAVQAFRVAPGITLLVDGGRRPFTTADATALQAWLASRGLVEEESP